MLVGDSVPRKATTIASSLTASQACVLPLLKKRADRPSVSANPRMPSSSGR